MSQQLDFLPPPAPSGTRIAVAGGRATCRADLIARELSRFVHRYPNPTILTGDATGVDAAAAAWAKTHAVPLDIFPADWSRHGRAAGPIRNRQMLVTADLLLAFPGGAGTADAINAGLTLGVRVIRPFDWPNANDFLALHNRVLAKKGLPPSNINCKLSPKGDPQ